MDFLNAKFFVVFLCFACSLKLYEEFQFVPGYTWTRDGEWELHGSRGPRNMSPQCFSLTLSFSLLSTPSKSRTRACLFHFLKCPPPSSLAVLSFTPAIVRSSLPSLSLALHRAYRTTASVWLTVYLKISIRLTRRGFESVPNYRNRCSCFLSIFLLPLG